MRKLLGGFFLILGGGLLGLACQRRRNAELQATREMLLFLEEMKAEIEWMQTPMPRLLDKLGKRTAVFYGNIDPPGMEDGFEAQWVALVNRTLLDEDCRAAVREMGVSLSRGGDSSRLISMAQSVLSSSISRREDAMVQKERLPTALGLCSGALLAILLS